MKCFLLFTLSNDRAIRHETRSHIKGVIMLHHHSGLLRVMNTARLGFPSSSNILSHGFPLLLFLTCAGDSHSALHIWMDQSLVNPCKGPNNSLPSLQNRRNLYADSLYRQMGRWSYSNKLFSQKHKLAL